MKTENRLAILGLAQKAGKVASGEYAAEQAVKRGEAMLLILAEDASGNTKKKFQNSASFYGVPVVTALTKEALGALLGRGERSVAAILDQGFANSIQKKIHL